MAVESNRWDNWPTFFSYLITNYEYSNFSVSQARFEDLPEDIIAMPSAPPPPTASPTTSPHNRISHSSIIGLTIGLIAFLILAFFLVYFTRKKLRENSQKNDMSKNTVSPRVSKEIKPAHISSLHEADSNSLYNQRELPDSGKVELLDEHSPSGSGNNISEMPQPPSPAPLCELGTRHTSIATSTLRRQSDRNRTAILVSTGIYRRESSDSSGALKQFPCVETRISASPRRKSLDANRPPPTPPRLTPEYLNRALPSPPSSESTQISPTKSTSSSPLSAKNYLQSLSSRTSVNLSDSGTAPPDTALDMIWKDYDMSWGVQGQPEPSLFSSSSTDIKIMMPPEVANSQIRQYPSLSSLSLSPDVEIAVPPGTPNKQIPSARNNREEEGEWRGHPF